VARGAEAGVELPVPQLAAVAGGGLAARERRLAGEAEVVEVREAGEVGRAVDGPDLAAGARREGGAPLPRQLGGGSLLPGLLRIFDRRNCIGRIVSRLF